MKQYPPETQQYIREQIDLVNELHLHFQGKQLNWKWIKENMKTINTYALDYPLYSFRFHWNTLQIVEDTLNLRDAMLVEILD